MIEKKDLEKKSRRTLGTSSPELIHIHRFRMDVVQHQADHDKWDAPSRLKNPKKAGAWVTGSSSIHPLQQKLKKEKKKTMNLP